MQPQINTDKIKGVFRHGLTRINTDEDLNRIKGLIEIRQLICFAFIRIHLCRLEAPTFGHPWLQSGRFSVPDPVVPVFIRGYAVLMASA
jgi:hypothetical protein